MLKLLHRRTASGCFYFCCVDQALLLVTICVSKMDIFSGVLILGMLARLSHRNLPSASAFCAVVHKPLLKMVVGLLVPSPVGPLQVVRHTLCAPCAQSRPFSDSHAGAIENEVCVGDQKCILAHHFPFFFHWDVRIPCAWAAVCMWKYGICAPTIPPSSVWSGVASTRSFSEKFLIVPPTAQEDGA